MSNLFTQQESEHIYLVSRGAKGEIRCFELWYEQIDDYFVIHRESCQYKGKVIQQPDIEIYEGKVNRDCEAQCILQFEHLIREKLDKGYKQLEKSFNEYSLSELKEILPEVNTDNNGFKKHMLAKSSDKVKQSVIDKEKYWYCSRKIDGVRASLYWDGKKIKSASRGGKDYNSALYHFIDHPKLIEFFTRHPDCILDGELYKHGKSLQQISGAARLEKNVYDCDWLEYYIYDVMYPKLPFEKRLKVLNQISKELNLGFNPYKEWKDDDLKIQMVPQEKVSGYDNIMNLHNKYVEEGFEGVVIRNPNKEYGFGKRTNDMIKIKKYKDSEFLVTDYELGLRGSEDMVFICETPNGNIFKAKPLGDRETKEEYVENFNSKYKNKFATIKYFYYSNGGDEETGVPLQPALIKFRPIDE